MPVPRRSGREWVTLLSPEDYFEDTYDPDAMEELLLGPLRRRGDCASNVRLGQDPAIHDQSQRMAPGSVVAIYCRVLL